LSPSTGVVYTYEEFLLAEDDAGNVSGVKEVHNEFLVGPLGEAVADTYIAAACTAALDATWAVPKRSVSVQVNHGWVTRAAKSGTTSSAWRPSSPWAPYVEFGALLMKSSSAPTPSPGMLPTASTRR